MIVTWGKTETGSLGRHFITGEFVCHCPFPSCKTQMVESELLRRLDLVRDEYGGPLSVTSGYRCKEYQEYLRDRGYETATGISQHELGHAADVKADDMAKLLPILQKHFSAIGVAKTWAHVDLRDDKERRWTYK